MPDVLSPKPTLHIVMEHREVLELQVLLNRALNCLEPNKWTPFAKELEQHVTQYLDKFKD